MLRWTRDSLLTGMVFAVAACQAEPTHKTLTGLMDVYEIDVASKVPGRIKELLVREGDRVEQGQKLAVMESQEIEAKLGQVRAARDAAEAKLRMARRGARDEEKMAAGQALDAARHQFELAEKTHKRMQSLLADKAVAQAKFDEVEFKYKAAKEKMSMAQAKFELVKKGARPEEIDALEALVRQGKSTMAEVESYARESVQHAPVAGEVSKIMLHPGELAATGYPILSLVDLREQWASFVVREDRLQKLKKGDTIAATVPALGKTVNLKVYHISALGDFATWRATSEKDNFDLKTFEVRARPVEQVDGLRPGMTVRWRVE